MCLRVCNGRAGGVRTLLQPARAQCLRLSERFSILICFAANFFIKIQRIKQVILFVQNATENIYEQSLRVEKKARIMWNVVNYSRLVKLYGMRTIVRKMKLIRGYNRIIPVSPVSRSARDASIWLISHSFLQRIHERSVAMSNANSRRHFGDESIRCREIASTLERNKQEG